MDIESEVAPAAGLESVHEKVRHEFLNSDATVIFYDHGSGEIADYLAISEEGDTVIFKLYHCKGSDEPQPGARMTDVYEVCGQAQKSVAWSSLARLERRLRTRRQPAKFIRGTDVLLRDILDRAKGRRQRFDIKVVQPGISKARLSRLPHGFGKLKPRRPSVVEACPFQICSTRCDRIEFAAGQIVDGTCLITKPSFQWREGTGGRLASYGHYEGGITGVDDKDPASGATWLGPYRVWLSGRGVLKIVEDDHNSRSHDSGRIEGTWFRSALQGAAIERYPNGFVREGLFDDGRLKDGYEYRRPYPWTAPFLLTSAEFANFGPTKTAIKLEANRFELGTSRGTSMLLPGWHGTRRGRQGFELIEYKDPVPSGRSYYPRYAAGDRECPYRETFGVEVPVAPSANGWRLWTINRLLEGPKSAITLSNELADIEFRSYRPHNGPGEVEFSVGGNSAGRQALAIDGAVFRTDQAARGVQPHAAMALARLCYAQKVENLASGRTADGTGLCPLVWVMLGRAYYCAVD